MRCGEPMRSDKRIPVAAAVICLAVLGAQVGLLASQWDPVKGISYQSSWNIAGLPLLDVRFPPPGLAADLTLQSQLDMCLARGVVACGPYATGVLALGGVSAGLFSCGLLSLAVLQAVGVVALGIWRALGVLALAANRCDVSTVVANNKARPAAPSKSQ